MVKLEFVSCIYIGTVFKSDLGEKRHNKLRTYKQMKTDFHVEPYCLEILSLKHRGALAKFRSGTVPIKVETGRYQNLDLSDPVHCFSITFASIVPLALKTRNMYWWFVMYMMI